MCVRLQPGENGELEGAQPVFDRHLLELSAITPSGQDAIGNKMRAFADQLKPYPQNMQEKKAFDTETLKNRDNFSTTDDHSVVYMLLEYLAVGVEAFTPDLVLSP